jgi:pimeloyl-ACP methyl ester carboxylesterase
LPWGLFILLFSGLLVLWAWLVVYTMWMLTHPPRRTYAWAVARSLPGDPSEIVLTSGTRGLAYEAWLLLSRGRELPVWDVCGLDPSGPTIIVTHGWGDSRVAMLGRVAALAPVMSRLIVWDMPGHGDSPRGSTCELGVREHEDLRALIERVLDESGQRGDRNARPLLLFGFSLGAGVSLVAAADEAARISAVIAEAPYRIPPTPARNVCRLRGLPYRTTLPAAMLLLGLMKGQGTAWGRAAFRGTRDGVPSFDRLRVAQRMRGGVKLLVVHAKADPVCPIEDGREIAGAGHKGRVLELEHAGHTDVWTRSELVEKIVGAIRELT